MNNRIQALLEGAKGKSKEELNLILDKADRFQGLSPEEVAALIVNGDKSIDSRMFEIAGKIKKHIYGNRIVMFAPLYVSDYCVNACQYCGYSCKNNFNRKRLTMDEIREEVKILEKMGHRRLAIEAGEDPKECPISYILEGIKTIYETQTDGAIRRVNINIAATTVEEYEMLKEAGIGTYILFQETYHKPTYEEMHPSGPKSDYEYHSTAFDRAMEAGIDDVGAGVLFGLYDWKFEVMGLMLHNEHLEQKFGVGFHTISVPRLCAANGITLKEYPHIVTDDEFLRLVAIIRLAVPFTGMIISTRETFEMRKKLIDIGISQVSAGSSVEVGGYNAREKGGSQFTVADDRDAMEIIEWLMDEGHIPSFCTACYRQGRTGDRFMQLAKTGNIKNVCLPNALMTLAEYSKDYGTDGFKKKAYKIIQDEVPGILDEKIRQYVVESLEKIEQGGHDYFI